MRFIDNFLNNITMYKVVLYGLAVLAVISVVFGATGILFYKPIQLIASFLILIVACFFSNVLFSKIFKAIFNLESSLITALILFFILIPPSSQVDYLVLILASVVAMLSKYMLAIRKKHIFNPAAVAAFIIGLLGFGNAIWWAGSDVLLPFVLIVGLLIVRKIRRFGLLFSFLAVAVITIGVVGLRNGLVLQNIILESFTSWPLIFFGTVMLTEPLTTPPTRKLQLTYGALAGFLFGLQFEIGPIYSTPEFALLLGNVFSYLVSPKEKLFLSLKNKLQLSPTIYEFIFEKNQQFAHSAGQYLEWTIPPGRADSRGNRRYFTIASSPTESDIKLGVRIREKQSSTFKKTLMDMQEGSSLVASQLTGDFVLPRDTGKKLVFIAGGIGITPFRSMIKYLIDKEEKRDIVLFYVVSHPDDIVYKEVFEDAQRDLGIKVVYVLTDQNNVPQGWTGKVGRISEEMIKSEVLDYQNRTYYISGANVMVQGCHRLLSNLGIPKVNIITDYFPGF